MKWMLILVCLMLPLHPLAVLPHIDVQHASVDEPPTKADLLQFLQQNEVPFAEDLVKVAIYESGHTFNSNLAKRNKNIFGMAKPGKRETTADKSVKGFYAYYGTYADGMRDIVLWVRYAPPAPNETFTEWLQRRGYNSVNVNYYRTLSRIRI